MAGLIEAVKNFFTFIGKIIQLVIELAKDLVYTIDMMTSIGASADGWLSFFPPAVTAVFIGGISIIVIYKIIGRD